MSATIYLEGGGDSKDIQVRCREGFRKLLEKCGLAGRMPRLFAAGGRAAAFDAFQTAHAGKQSADYVAMLIDSEDPMADIEATWAHLKQRPGDGWDKPAGADDEQVLFMTTCMETWIICERAALHEHYGSSLQVSALPALVDMENRRRQAVQDALALATRKCSNAYSKGKRSFRVLELLIPANLEPHLPSFVRVVRVLRSKL